MRQHRTIGGRRLSYIERPARGAGRPLVLLHAFPFNADMWAPQFEAVPDDWRIIAPDFRGFGASDADSGDLAAGGPSIDDYARDLVALLHALGVREAVFGGLSLGGYVAFALLRLLRREGPGAAQGPGMAGLVLADTRPQADTAEGRANRLRMVDLLEREGTAAVARSLLPRLVAEETRRRRPDVPERVRELMLAARPPAIAAALYRMMDRPDSTGLLAGIRCPTLIVVGERDELTPPELSYQMQARIPNATIAVLPDTGHMSNLENPEGFNAALTRFLDGVQPGLEP